MEVSMRALNRKTSSDVSWEKSWKWLTVARALRRKAVMWVDEVNQLGFHGDLIFGQIPLDFRTEFSGPHPPD